MHLAAQYLAAAANSFLDHQPDDSQANLAFDPDHQCLKTRELDQAGSFLALNYASFSLDWQQADQPVKRLSLSGLSHRAVLDWLDKATASIVGKTYQYAVSYEWPYDISETHIHQTEGAEVIRRLIDLRTRAQEVLTQFLTKNNLKSEVRVWPHHFDTGAFALLDEDSQTSLGIGLAIPDTLSPEFYYYASAYQGEGALSTSQFGALTKGRWIDEGFKGAILPAEGISVEEGLSFFEEVIKKYKQGF